MFTVSTSDLPRTRTTVASKYHGRIWRKGTSRITYFDFSRNEHSVMNNERRRVWGVTMYGRVLLGVSSTIVDKTSTLVILNLPNSWTGWSFIFVTPKFCCSKTESPSSRTETDTSCSWYHLYYNLLIRPNSKSSVDLRTNFINSN